MATESELHVIESSENKNEPENENNKNNNFEENKNSGEAEIQENETETQEMNEKRKKFFQQYIYQQNYHEALRSLLWEPYDCRDNSESWFYRCLDDYELAIFEEVPGRKPMSTSESSLSSSSSYSSLDEILTVEMTQKSVFNAEKKHNFHMKKGKEVKRSLSCSGMRKLGSKSKTKEKGFSPDSNELKEEEEQWNSEFSESRCSGDPLHSIMNIEIMVSDLDSQNGGGVSSCCSRDGALKLHRKEKYASTSQCEIGCCVEGSSVSDCNENNLNSVNSMLVAVEGTLEPRDSSEDTQLVSPDNSLDLNDNSMRMTGPNQVESCTSGNSVCVVNCYRAVPVSVVSTVPTIKCLNTHENVSNVSIIQTTSTLEPKQVATSRQHTQTKRLPPKVSSSPVPSTSRTKVKASNRVINKNQNCNVPNLEQNLNHTSKFDKERPKSANFCLSEINSEQLGQTPGLCENAATGLSNGCSALANHNRSVSNPVLGNQIKTISTRYGSQQNIPIRLETHFGPNSPDGIERCQTYLIQRSVTNSEACPEQERTLSQEAKNNNSVKPVQRTFISTEAQTDDVPLGIHSRNVINREQRRRERRERRHQRRLHQSVLNSGSVWQTNVDMMHRDRRGLPDILNSHMPPPYSAVTVPAMPALPTPIHVPPPLAVPSGPPTAPHLVDTPPGQPLPHQNGLRFPFPLPGGGRRSRNQMFAHEEETPKSCCGVVVTQTVSIRWFIVMISFVGICCVVVGTVLGAMKASGREHLTVSLLMIGVGIVLVTVSVVAWRLTSQDAPSCRSMLGLGGAEESGNEPNQRFVPRMPPSYGRPHHPYAAMMYPEFQYRPPPPSYQASMQEYRLRLLLLERPNETTAGLQAAMSPPPTYRSQAGSTLGLRAPALCRSLPQSEYSHPPSYRSRTSSIRPTLDPNGDTLGSVNHSRNSSLLSHVSDQNGNVSQAVVNVISVMGNTVDLHRGDTDLQIDSIKLGVDEEVPIPPLRMLLNKGKRSPTTSSDDIKAENVNLVTIVTVSDSNSTPNRDHSVESDVLAHL